MRITDIITEGYTIMPSIDPKYTVIPDMEGPFQLRNGKVVYYDPKQGQYYDRDTDQYISYEDYREMDAPTAQSNKMNQLQGRIDLIKRMIKRTNNAEKKQQLTVELQSLLNDAKVNENVAHTVKKAVKSFKRGIQGWEKGMHDVESVRAATKTLSAAQKDEILRSNPPKGSPAEFQKKLIQRELRNQSETVDQRPYSVVKTTDKPQIVKPTTGGESPHPYQGKLVGEDSAARNRNRKMAQATDYEQRAKATRSPIKAAHFRKMADDIRSRILQDESPHADVKTQEAADVGTTGYQWAHGKKPSGQGSWFFTVHRRGVDFARDEEGKDYIQLNMMTYSDAKRAARAWAKQQGHSQIFVAENAQHIDEVAYELGLQDHEPRVVKGVRGLKSLNFTKKFPNHAAQERWMDRNPDYEVRQVQRESATSSKDKNQSQTQVASWGSSKVIHAAAGDQAHSMMLSLQNQNDLAKLSDGDYTKITDELGEPLTVSRKNQQFTLSTANGKLSVTVDAADIISLYAR